VAGDALRYMNNPTQDGYSADYYPDRLYPGSCTPSSVNDYCGVHGNSGIANLAFYLMVVGGTHPQGKTSTVVPAIGMAKARQIWYRALTVYLDEDDNFLQVRSKTSQAAADLYGGYCGDTAKAVRKAWNAVGVIPSGLLYECAVIQL
jgi:Zn-dependent metalloprotease